MTSKNVMIIGGGIAGIQAALDLAERGNQVIIVEKSPSLGGNMAKLDKTFPTNDCSMCILSPKLVSVARHSNVTMKTLSEVTKVDGEPGDFKVTINSHPRYVDINKCVGCGDCASKCPSKVPNEFDEEMAIRKAIYVPYPQAVPLKYSIDKEKCIYFKMLAKGKEGRCKACEKICQANAVDFSQEATEETINVGAIIMATGYKIMDPNIPPEYGYDKYENVITSMEFERTLNASGPTSGDVVRPSDQTMPKSIAFIQCHRSRDIHRGVSYCSRVCCMYAIKEAIIAKEHEKDIEDMTVYYMDVRAFGKNFEEYYQNAKREGINFFRGKPANIIEDPETKDLILEVEDTETGKRTRKRAQLVVLATAMVPPESNPELAKVLGVELDNFGFVKARDPAIAPLETSREGIFVCGCVKGPKDIPDTVSEASGAAANAARFLLKHEGNRPYDEPSPTDMVSAKPRIGVFICHCGRNIGSIVDVAKVAEFAKGLHNVVFSDHNLYTCSDSTLSDMRDIIKEKHLNRIVVASCSPKTHEPLFRGNVKEAGLNPYTFSMANIREHCSWVHREEKDLATAKAMDLVSAAVARAKELEPINDVVLPMTQKVLVVGGGIAGMAAAIETASQGIESVLVEKSNALGGRLNELSHLSPGDRSTSEVLNEFKDKLDEKKVRILTETEVEKVSGFIGNFDVTFKGKTEDTERFGAIILAIGFNPYEPSKGEYGHGESPAVITNLELEKILTTTPEGQAPMIDGKPIKSIALFHCVGSREPDDFSGCSRYCCEVTLKHALDLRNRGLEVTDFFRDIRTFNLWAEDLYRDTRKSGVVMHRFQREKKPQVVAKPDGGVKITYFDQFLGKNVAQSFDAVVLGIGMRARATDVEKLSKLLKVPKGQDGFFLEKHPKLGPVETTTEGIYLCGTCQFPKNVADSIIQAQGAASKAASELIWTTRKAEGAIAENVEEDCIGCGLCERNCPYNAIEMKECSIPIGDGHFMDSKKAIVLSAACKGCGKCVSNCPTGSMRIKHYDDEQIFAQILATF